MIPEFVSIWLDSIVTLLTYAAWTAAIVIGVFAAAWVNLNISERFYRTRYATWLFGVYHLALWGIATLSVAYLGSSPTVPREETVYFVQLMAVFFLLLVPFIAGMTWSMCKERTQTAGEPTE